uniref:KxDL domain-containing protein n=1 Tax=Panagrolaimus sp. JU765 TaxID=591449 RepID=A0AC34QR84_9BILA
MSKIQRDQSKTSSDGGSPVREENFVDSLMSQIDQDNVDDIIKIQKKSMKRFEKTNEMLVNCVALSEKRLEKAKSEFAAHKSLIIDAKNDLESIFKKLRNIKQILMNKYPEIYQEKAAEFKMPTEDED